MALSQLPLSSRAQGVTAVLGPTNTGKTHLAIERMLGHGAGLIGLPLRLLAREIYNGLVERIGAAQVALVTGEEKIKPQTARYWVSTVEAMPRDLDVPFVALDEIQITADLERGHVFTDRLLNRRGSAETLLLGAATMRPMVEKLLPGVTIVSRPRLSNLSFSGEKKLTRLPRRSAIVAFSAEDVYAIAELIRRQRGGAAVVLGALSPRTRNAQVEMYQNGDVDYLIATDAIGMGLNLDVDHVAFAGDRKFDGYQFRRLSPAEMAQIAGRAGRHVRDGTFGTTGRCDPFEKELVHSIESHSFEPIRTLQWRNPDPVFSSIATLQSSLTQSAAEPGLTRAPDADDVRVLGLAARDDDVRRFANGPAAVARLWDIAQLPDYRKTSPHAHADLVISLYSFLMRGGTIPDDWFARQVALQDRIDGDIDTLSARIAHIRTWTFVANRPDWLKDPAHWQAVTRNVEDRLSDALHERLAQRFVDRRTSVLMRRLRENTMLETEITKTGDVIVEGQSVGTLQGFQFVPDPNAGEGDSGRALRAAAAKVLSGEIEARAQKFSQAPDTDFALAIDGMVRWIGEPVGKLAGSEKVLAPRIRLLADEQLTGPSLEAVQTRLDIWISSHVSRLLGPLLALESAEDLTGLGRGLAFRLVEDLGILERTKVAEDLKALDQEQRAGLRKHGVRFGAYHIYIPTLMKPAPRALAVQLWALIHGGLDQKGLDDIPHLAASGRTSIPADQAVDRAIYRLIGYKVCGERAVRVDILERLADLIRPAVAYRPGTTIGDPPAGAADGDGFVVTPQMTSLVGCSGEDFASILKGLGYRVDKRKGPAITQPIRIPASMVPLQPSGSPIEASEKKESVPDGAAVERATPDASAETSLSQADQAQNPGDLHSLEKLQSENPVDAIAGVTLDTATPSDAPSSGPELTTVKSEEAAPEGIATPPLPTDDAVSSTSTENSDGAIVDLSVTELEVPQLETEIWRLSRFERPAQPRPQRQAKTARQSSDGAQRNGPHSRPSEPAPVLEDRSRQFQNEKPKQDRREKPAWKRSKDKFSSDHQGGSRPAQNRERPGARFETERDRSRSWSSEGTKSSKDKAPDPHSPFAKLLALKEQMQGKPNDTN